MCRVIQLMVVAAIMFTYGSAQSGRIPGVWQLLDVTTTGPDGSTSSSLQPNQYIFTKKHYSILSVTAKEPRPVTDTSKATADELRNVFVNGFVANAGAYEVKGDMITFRPHVAKSPSFMQEGNFTVSKFKLDGDVLTLVSHSNREGPVTNPTTVRLKRIE